MKKWMEAWGAYLLAALCLGVIVFSALWTGPRNAAPPGAQALSDGSQRLADVTPAPTAPPYAKPCGGSVARGFSQDVQYFEQTGLWQAHPGVDYAAAPGDAVYAMADGTARLAPAGVEIDHGNGLQSLYRGLAEIRVKEGQRVRRGDVIGLAGGFVPFEGDGFVCVSLYKDGKAVDPDRHSSLKDFPQSAE